MRETVNSTRLDVVRSGSVISRDELEESVRRYHRLREAHRHARPGSRVRRHLHEKLKKLAKQFDRLLAEGVPAERDRQAWLEHLHGGAGEPVGPGTARPLLFRGRSATGSRIEILAESDGTLDVVIDGATVERLESAEELLTRQAGLTFRVGDVSFKECFSASATALAALRAMLEPGATPPYRYARELLLDGLVDRDFGLSPRGRRALELGLDQRSTPVGEAALSVRVTARGPVGKRDREAAEKALAQLVRFAPRRLLFARAILVKQQDPAVARRAFARGTLDASGEIIRAHATAPRMSEAIDLLADRLRGRLTELGERKRARRREPGVAGPGRWRHGDLPASNEGEPWTS